jgi:hypothetical protein
MHRQLWLIACACLLFQASAASAHSISGSFATVSGDTYDVQTDENGAVKITDSNGGDVGEAEVNGDNAWDIYAPNNHYLGSIRTDGSGNITAYGSTGEFWGSGKTRESLSSDDDDDD